jgi:hypothetical protein
MCNSSTICRFWEILHHTEAKKRPLNILVPGIGKKSSVTKKMVVNCVILDVVVG